MCYNIKKILYHNTSNFIIFLLSGVSLIAHGQNNIVGANSHVITGKVYDSSTRLPIADAAIYLNNSSYYTMTNDSGAFYLKVLEKMNTPLIISRVSYETFVVNDPFKQKSIEIPLIAKENVLSEVVIKADRFSRQEKLKAFEQQFLGDDKAGRSCTILNKDDIQIFFDEDEKTLHATNEQPIIVDNKYLGYRMYCSIIDFQVRYWNKSLNKRSIKSALLRCNTFFMDTAPNNPTVKKQRDDAYKGSLNYFFKNLTTQTLKPSNYIVYNHKDPVDPYKYFDIIDSLSQKIVRIKPKTDINTSTELELPYPVSGIITVVNSTKRYSDIYFLTDEFSVDAFGLINKKDYVYVSGQMGEQRMGNALPLNYEIASTISDHNNIQDIQNIPDRLVSLFQKQLEVFPQEKIYVHTDKPYYISGEKIWFRAYLANAMSHEPVSINRNVYVELINPLDSVIDRVKIRQEEGAFYGYLSIPEDTPEGNYTLRAYTAFMRNQNESDFFTKTIHIGDPQARLVHTEPSFTFESNSRVDATFRFSSVKTSESLVPQSVKVSVNGGKQMNVKPDDKETTGIRFDLPMASKKRILLLEMTESGKLYRQFISVPVPDNDFDVSFYPEGGSIMQGTFCKIAFKAMKSNGQSTDISGIVYDQTGKEIREFHSEHLGMGSFSLRAEKGKSYYAICQIDKGESKRFDLPAAVDSGYALSVNRVKDKMYMTVLKPAGTAPDDELYLLAHTRGMVHFADRWNPEKEYIIYPKQFPSGVLHLILFDSDLHPVSERLVSINNPDKATVSYQSDKENYAFRSLVKNKVILTDSGGQVLTGSFSVAVTSDQEVQTDSTSNILTQLLLTSDLRGNIENPDYYFQDNNSSSHALDLLMCTQGWRRYNIAELAQGHLAHPLLPVETFPEISGIVNGGLLHKPAKNVEVIAVGYQCDYLEKTKTDKDGRFYFRGIECPDSTQFIVRAVSKGIIGTELILDKEIFPGRTLLPVVLSPEINSAGINSSKFEQYVDKAERQYVYEHGVRMIQLPEVQITAQQKPLRKSIYYDPPSASDVITEERIQKSGATNVFQLLSMLPGVLVTADNNTHGFRVSIRGGDAVFLLDDEIVEQKNIVLQQKGINGQKDIVVQTGINDYLGSISDIEQIEVVKGAATAIFGMRMGVANGGSGGGVIAIHTKRGENTKDNTVALNIKGLKPLGYQQPVEFYAPKYDTPEKRNAQAPDLRTTIYWQPVVQTDSQGEASFEFYTADESTSYTVVIEGLADDGSIIRQEGKLLVKDK